MTTQLSISFLFSAALLVIFPVLASADLQTYRTYPNCAPCTQFSRELFADWKLLRDHPEEKRKFPEFTLEQYRTVLAAEITPMDHVYLTKKMNSGKEIKIEFFAANFPDENKIELNLSMWPILHENGSLRNIIEFHEAMGLLRLEKDAYQISSRRQEYLNGISRVELPGPPQTFRAAEAGIEGSSKIQQRIVRKEYHVTAAQVSKFQGDQYCSENQQNSFATLLTHSGSEWVVICLARLTQ